MLRLVVKNFGVLKDIDIELNKTNLFIGENGSGKSVLAKLITIVTSFYNYSDTLYNEFKKFDINFLKDNTHIKLFENNNIIFEIKSNEVEFPEKVQSAILKRDNLIKKLDSYEDSNNLKIDDIMPISFISQYIPAERNLISLLNKSIYSLISSEIPLPNQLLKFGSQYEKAKKEIKELDLLGMNFKVENGDDRIYYDKDNYLSLEHSSSGIQTALPLYLTMKYFNNKHNDIIIEEPEQNLYPKSQVDTVKYIIENSTKNLYIMTHSPYVLSTLNILLFAYKASNTNDILKDKISKIIPVEQQINPDEFSAYFIENGTAKSIKSKRGLISENSIDESSDEIDNEFNNLMSLYREYKND